MLFKSLFICASLATFVVSATPLPDSDLLDRDLEPELYDRDFFDEVLPQTLPHGTYSKNDAINFVKNIPNHKLTGGGVKEKQGTIHTADAKGNTNSARPQDGHRLDYQGKTSDGKHNLQVQINGATGKTTVGGVKTNGNWSPNRLKKELTHSIMHPAKDKHGNEYLRTQKSGKAPTHPDGRKMTNAEARKGKPRTRKPKNPNSKSNRKAVRKSWGKREVVYYN